VGLNIARSAGGLPLSLDHLRDDEDRFSFAPQAALESEAISVLDADRVTRSLALACQVSYHWDIASDRLTWSANTKAVLGFDPASVRTGRQFATLMDTENFFSRYDTVLRSSQRDVGKGVAYEIEYRLKAADGASPGAWVEDCGHWFSDRTENPKEALGVMRVANERHMRDQQMNFLSNCDPLTGMMNRARMTSALDESITVATTDRLPCAFAILAVNNLDVMNEAYGFDVADEVIVSLGSRLRQVMRTGDGIARYSGSKFGIILNGCKPDELNAALERFLRAVRDSVIETKMGPVWALLSIGAVSLPAIGEGAATAIAHAEDALNDAFRLPSDGYVVFSSSDQREARRKLNARCATEIVSCLQDGLFKLAFQPVFSAETGQVVMHEALLRMEDASGTLITAGHLVPIAERLGLIRLIDRAVLQLAVQTLQTYPDAKLSINISATTVTDPRWNCQLLDIIAGTPEPAKRLVIEITETAALGNLSTSHDFVKALRDLGCGVALDDFGAGYTSYRNLKELPISLIKLDGSFCCNLGDGSENATFVRSMVQLAHAFGHKVVAEWVDTAADAEILAGFGVDYLQGNMLGEASIVAPWKDQHGAAMQQDAPNLAPVDSLHFRHMNPGVAAPASAIAIEAPPSVEISAINLLDDATLDAEIASLNLASDAIEDEVLEATPQSPEPLFEFASEEVVEPSAEPENLPDMEDNLHQLREALAALNAAFGEKSSTTEEDRLAS
jgi:diguanylate cyclase (GGDEF)-like protein